MYVINIYRVKRTSRLRIHQLPHQITKKVEIPYRKRRKVTYYYWNEWISRRWDPKENSWGIEHKEVWSPKQIYLLINKFLNHHPEKKIWEKSRKTWALTLHGQQCEDLTILFMSHTLEWTKFLLIKEISHKSKPPSHFSVNTWIQLVRQSLFQFPTSD